MPVRSGDIKAPGMDQRDAVSNMHVKKESTLTNLQATKPPLPCIAGVQIKDIPEYPGYAISDDGFLWSCRSSSKARPYTETWRKMNQKKPGMHGYALAELWNSGTVKYARIHRLVLEAFVGPCPLGMVSRHLDGNRLNNSISNLQWGTQQENSIDAINHGTHPGLRHGSKIGFRRGSAHFKHKLTESDVLEIIKLLPCQKKTSIAVKFHVSEATVQSIAKGRNWKWLTQKSSLAC